jgi:hypothetical protein
MADWPKLRRRQPDRSAPVPLGGGGSLAGVTPPVETGLHMPSADRCNGQHGGAEGRWWWLGLHGGAGVTTLCAAVPGGVDAGGVVPPTDGVHRPPVLCVVRSHAGGLRRAQERAPWWRDHAADHDLVGLVVVADAPGLVPKPLGQLLRLTAGGWPKVWRLPWVHPWRVGLAPSAETTPTAYLELGQELGERFGTSAPVMRLLRPPVAPTPVAAPTTPEALPIGGAGGDLLRRVRRLGRESSETSEQRRTGL